eukprot:m.91474 g.91474  ORF g.91474 m.91474 type:complete len:848 (+) comp9906_c0_seq3:251-2794(+)
MTKLTMAPLAVQTRRALAFSTQRASCLVVAGVLFGAFATVSGQTSGTCLGTADPAACQGTTCQSTTDQGNCPVACNTCYNCHGLTLDPLVCRINISAFDCSVDGVNVTCPGKCGTCPSLAPTTSPTSAPTTSPTSAPTTLPPTSVPTEAPTSHPTALPTGAPTTPGPTAVPTAAPTNTPTSAPTTLSPTALPTTVPTAAPTVAPTMSTTAPTAVPTVAPTTATPTAAPTRPQCRGVIDDILLCTGSACTSDSDKRNCPGTCGTCFGCTDTTTDPTFCRPFTATQCETFFLGDTCQALCGTCPITGSPTAPPPPTAPTESAAPTDTAAPTPSVAPTTAPTSPPESASSDDDIAMIAGIVVGVLAVCAMGCILWRLRREDDLDDVKYPPYDPKDSDHPYGVHSTGNYPYDYQVEVQERDHAHAVDNVASSMLSGIMSDALFTVTGHGADVGDYEGDDEDEGDIDVDGAASMFGTPGAFAIMHFSKQHQADDAGKPMPMLPPATPEESSAEETDFTDLEDMVEAADRGEMTKQYKAGFRLWQADPSVIAEMKEAFHDRFRTDRRFTERRAIKARRTVAKLKWNDLSPERKRFWISKAMTSEKTKNEKEASKTRWFAVIVRLPDAPWGLIMEPVAGEGYRVVEIRPKELESVYETQGLRVGVFIDEIDGAPVSDLEVGADGVLTAPGTKLYLALHRDSSIEAPKRRQSWRFNTVNQNETITQRSAREAEARKAEEEATRTFETVRRNSVRRLDRASRRSMQLSRRHSRRQEDPDHGSSDDSTDVESDTDTDDGGDALDGFDHATDSADDYDGFDGVTRMESAGYDDLDDYADGFGDEDFDDEHGFGFADDE